MNRIRKILLILIALFLSSNADNFIVIENPSALIIYDKFEAPVAASTIGLEFVPFQIIDKNWDLGDGVSEAYKVTSGGNEYYIRKDDDGNLEGLSNAGRVKKYTATSSTDTVTKISSAKILTGVYPGSKKASNFTDRAIVVFKYKTAYYLQNMRRERSFGWSNKSGWQIKKTVFKKVEINLDSYLEEQINTLLEDVNKKYIKLFSFYNTKLNGNRVVPKWIILKTGNTVRCHLKGTNAYISQLEVSTQRVVQSLMTIVQGEPFDVDYDSGIITISPVEGE